MEILFFSINSVSSVISSSLKILPISFNCILAKLDSDKLIKFNLKLALMSLSESNLAKMQLNDMGNIFNEEDITELTEFIEKNNISINITLSGLFLTSVYQRRVDFATSASIL